MIEKMKISWLAKARDFPTFPNIHMLCLDEGFDDFEVCYIGGLWVMVEFRYKLVCKNSLANEELDHWILEKCPWDKNFVSPNRMVWLDVEGILLRAWSKVSFCKVLVKWGSAVHVENDHGEDMYKNRVCVLNSCHDIISEVVNVWVDGFPFGLRRHQVRLHLLFSGALKWEMK